MLLKQMKYFITVVDCHSFTEAAEQCFISQSAISQQIKWWRVVFMNNVVHFNMILEINQLFKENNIEYSIHGVGGCTCGGLELRQDGKSYPTDKILEIINGSLKNNWIYVQENKNQPGFLTVHSKFDKKP